MKKTQIALVLLLSTLFISACSSLGTKKEDLEQSPVCTVWKDGILGSKTVIQVQGELARQKMTCWVMNTFACTYTDYHFRTSTSDEIVSSLPPADKTIGTLKGDVLSVYMSGANVSPFELKDGRGDYSFQGPIGPKQSMTVEYNKACTVREAALGLLTMISK